MIDDSFNPGQYVATKGMHLAANRNAGWQQGWFRPWVRVDLTHTYWVANLFVGGGFYRTNNRVSGGPVTVNGIQLVNSFQSTALDLTLVSPTMNANANAVDVLFYPD